MLEILSTPHNRALTFALSAVCCASAIVAVAVGLTDNPPGILLAFLAGTAFVLAFVHPWRTAKQFRFLFYGSILGFVFFGILHNVFDAVASKWANAGALRGLLGGLSVAAFFLAILLFPPAFLVGFVGCVAMLIRNRRQRKKAPDTAA